MYACMYSYVEYPPSAPGRCSTPVVAPDGTWMLYATLDAYSKLARVLYFPGIVQRGYSALAVILSY